MSSPKKCYNLKSFVVNLADLMRNFAKRDDLIGFVVFWCVALVIF